MREVYPDELYNIEEPCWAHNRSLNCSLAVEAFLCSKVHGKEARTNRGMSRRGIRQPHNPRYVEFLSQKELDTVDPFATFPAHL